MSRPTFAVAWVFISLVVAGSVRAADEALQIEAKEKWSNVFADKDVEFHFSVKAMKAFNGRAAWNLSANQRVIQRGEAKATVAAGKAEEIRIKFRTPEVKAGVVLRAVVTVSLVADGKVEASHEKELWIFPADPMAGRSEWLKELKIRLFDPASATADVLKKTGLPFEEITNTAAIAELSEGMLVIGEGVNFRDYPELPEANAKAAAKGVPVLCLAPSGGLLGIPGTEDAAAFSLFSLAFRRSDMITELDKRLDAAAWPPNGKVIASTIHMKSENGKVVGEISADAAGWPWLAATFPKKKGKLVVCGFGIIKGWEAGPTPRYLFVRLLEWLSS